MTSLSSTSSDTSILTDTRKEKKPRKPRTPKAPSSSDGTVSTREIYKLVAFYNERIRRHDKQEQLGVYRQIQRMVANGIGLGDISQAMQNYIDDVYVREQPQQRRHSIRTFMQPEKIRTWSQAHLSADPTFASLDRLEAYRKANAARV